MKATKSEPANFGGAKVFFLKISTLKPAEYNPRKISRHDLEQLKASIKKFGAVQPAVVNQHPTRKNIIVGGHQRIEAARQLGHREYPCILVSLALGLEKELNIRLNRNQGIFEKRLLEKNFEAKGLFNWGFLEKELKFNALSHEAEIPLTPELLETHNYIVLYFNRETDWLVAQKTFGIDRVRALKQYKHGVGRVGLGRIVDGMKVMKKMKR